VQKEDVEKPSNWAAMFHRFTQVGNAKKLIIANDEYA